MMTVGARSLMNSQTALQTVSHNIANKTTEGFSRQRVEILTNPAASSGNLQIGMGARAGVVTRVNNPWLEKQLQKENMSLGYMETRADGMVRVEQVYNEQVNKGLNHYIDEFFNSFRELANTPESLASRTLVRESADAMITDFKRVDAQLQGIQIDLDGQIKVTVDEVNQMAKEVASLNEKIQQIEVQKTPANDERDRRDLLIKKIGERIDITWAENKEGQVAIMAAGTAVLVSGSESGELRTTVNGETSKVDVLFAPTAFAQPSIITQQVKGGKIGGALEIRDQTIEEYKRKNDQLAFAIATEVNSIHREGFDRYGKPGDDFFAVTASPLNSAQSLAINSTVALDVGNIAIASRPNAPGDNTVANAISSLQHQRIMDDFRSTFNDFYNTQVGEVGALTMRAGKSKEAQVNILAQLNNIRESISGVSLDEEATKMIEFQKSYDASARMIKTADEMFDTILNLKRL